MATIQDYPFKYEMHLHTSEASKCGSNTGAEMARAHKEAGYAGIFVTNHAWGGNTCIDRELPYREWIEQYAKGYYNALEEGEKIGLQVFFGMEAGFNSAFYRNGLENVSFADSVLRNAAFYAKNRALGLHEVTDDEVILKLLDMPATVLYAGYLSNAEESTLLNEKEYIENV